MKEKKYIVYLLCLVLVNITFLSLIDQFKNIKTRILHLSVRIKQLPEDNIYRTVQSQSVFRITGVYNRSVYPSVISQPYKLNNEGLCRGVGKVSVVVMVHTAPKHFKRRNILRETFLNTTYYSPESIRVIFLLGLTLNQNIQNEIGNESVKYRDIVQGYFIDSYRNLTNKGVMGYKWISEHCMNAEFVIKMDDDVFINFFKVFEEMYFLKSKTKYILCNKIGKNRMRIVRKKRSKWFVSEDDYKRRRTFPLTYCSGFAVFISTDLIPMLYRAAISTPFFWVDDFYLFGLLPSKVPEVVHHRLNLRQNMRYPKGKVCYEKYGSKCTYAVVYMSLYGDKAFQILWEEVVKDRRQSVYGNYYMDLPPFPEQKTKPLQPNTNYVSYN